MHNLKESDKNNEQGNVTSCKVDLSRYFHPQDLVLAKRFEFVYKIFSIRDEEVANEVGIDKSTMSRYRRGIFIPTSDMKIRIAKAISKLAEYPVDSAVIWGEDLIYIDWRKQKESQPSQAGLNTESKVEGKDGI